MDIGIESSTPEAFTRSGFRRRSRIPTTIDGESKEHRDLSDHTLQQSSGSTLTEILHAAYFTSLFITSADFHQALLLPLPLLKLIKKQKINIRNRKIKTKTSKTKTSKTFGRSSGKSSGTYIH